MATSIQDPTAALLEAIVSSLIYDEDFLKTLNIPDIAVRKTAPAATNADGTFEYYENKVEKVDRDNYRYMRLTYLQALQGKRKEELENTASSASAPGDEKLTTIQIYESAAAAVVAEQTRIDRTQLADFINLPL